MFSCFAPPPGKSALSDGAYVCLGAVVDRVGQLYRGPAKCLLINDAGVLEFESEGGTVRVDMTTLENLCVLKRASLKMADGLGGGGGGSACIPAMHLKGDGNGNVVSCFEAGHKHLLVVVAEMHATSAELFDTAAAEAKMRDCLHALAASLDAAPA